MVLFENDENEKLAQADRAFNKKANTVGATGRVVEEPFVGFPTLPNTQVMRSTPTSDTNFATPDYDDFSIQQGSVGTRYGVNNVGTVVPIRLHSYLPSGLSNGESCQTFLVIDPTNLPTDHSPITLNNSRLFPLIGPEFSNNRTHAAESDGTKRGFRLALYPAKTTAGVGTPLEADTAAGPISIEADPGATVGVGAGGYWTVDYDNGIVRFSRAPLNGSTGVMNPNDVYGDIYGYEVAQGNGGAITMFAVFYKYEGEFGLDINDLMTTVGDGYVSTGTYTGTAGNVIQAAVDSLPSVGGTVFIKGGSYDVVEPIKVRGGVRIQGLGGVKITRPRLQPAFLINSVTVENIDGYQVIDGVEIYPRDGVSNGGAIELGSSTTPQTIDQVRISNCVLYGEDDAPAIAFAPTFDCEYKGVRIQNNIFKAANGMTNPVYISEIDRGATVGVRGFEIASNDFQVNNTTPSDAVIFPGVVVDEIDTISIYDNNMRHSKINFNIAVVSFIDNMTISDNEIRNLDITDDINRCIIANNIFNNAVNLSNIERSIISGNLFVAATVMGDITNSNISNNVLESTFTYGTVDSDSVLLGNNKGDSLISIEDGYVGIGTTSPVAELHIEPANTGLGYQGRIRLETSAIGRDYIDDDHGGLELVTSGMNITSKYTQAIKFMSDDFNLGGGDDFFLAGMVGRATQTYSNNINNGMAIDFFTNPGSSGPSAAFDQVAFHIRRISTGAARVGIGEDNPAQSIHISSTVPIIRMEDTDGVNGSHYAEISTDSSVGTLAIKANQGSSDDGSLIRFDVQGNVGLVNIADPNDLSRIGGGIVGISNSDLADPYNAIDVDGEVVIGATYAGAELAPLNGLLVEGDVGIGTPSPDAKLHIDMDGGAVPTISSLTGLVINNSSTSTDNTYLSIIAGAVGLSGINFGDTGDENAGIIAYDHDKKSMLFDSNDLSVAGTGFGFSAQPPSDLWRGDVLYAGDNVGFWGTMGGFRGGIHWNSYRQVTSNDRIIYDLAE